MVISEFYLTREDGVDLYRIYSDSNFELQHRDTLKIFGEIIEDNIECINDFIETENKVPNEIIQMLEDNEQELTQEEIATMLEEVF
jgi:hypothetical protein